MLVRTVSGRGTSVAILAGAVWLAMPSIASAVPVAATWTNGNGDADFNNTANWSGTDPGRPVNNQVGFNSTPATGTINVTAPITIGGIAMNASSPARTLTGSDITLGFGDQTGFQAIVFSSTQPGQ